MLIKIMSSSRPFGLTASLAFSSPRAPDRILFLTKLFVRRRFCSLNCTSRMSIAGSHHVCKVAHISCSKLVTFSMSQPSNSKVWNHCRTQDLESWRNAGIRRPAQLTEDIVKQHLVDCSWSSVAPQSFGGIARERRRDLTLTHSFLALLIRSGSLKP